MTAKKRRPKPVHQLTSGQFEALFPVGEEAACQRYLVARRWPNGVRCPRCGNTVLYDASSYKSFHWQCRKCAPQGYRFSCIAGTIFENTNKPLRDWFKVVHLMLASKKGMSALQIQRFMGFGSYKTAWGMCHKIRTALVEPEQKLGGIVEIDETYVGGKDKNRHWDKRSGTRGRGYDPRKMPAIGAVKRKGNVIARAVLGTDSQTIENLVREAISNKVSLLCTDAYPIYKAVLKDGYPHGVVDHSIGEHVVGAIHTNTIEGFWSIFKRSVVGTFHNVSRKYLPLYVAEFQFRYNNRFNSDIFGTAIAEC